MSLCGRGLIESFGRHASIMSLNLELPMLTANCSDIQWEGSRQKQFNEHQISCLVHVLPKAQRCSGDPESVTGSLSSGRQALGGCQSTLCRSGCPNWSTAMLDLRCTGQKGDMNPPAWAYERLQLWKLVVKEIRFNRIIFFSNLELHSQRRSHCQASVEVHLW